MRRRCATPLVLDTLQRALGRRHPAADLLHHSDRGSQDARDAYHALRGVHGIVWSMRGQGECLGNAVAERFFGRVKRAWPAHRSYATRQEASDDIIAYIAMFYHSRRRHSYLGYVSPKAYEKW